MTLYAYIIIDPFFIGSAETDDFFFIVLEYIEGCDLFSYLEQENQSKPISEDIVKYLMIQLLDAVDYAHTNGIFHMDIKLDNIMIRPSDKFIKLIDFGLCDFIIGDDDKTSRRVGSEEYCPPEIIDGMYSEFSGRKVDIWCLGVVMYALLCARFPFSIKERRRSISLNKKHPSLTFPSFVTQDAKDVIRKMLSLNPKDRPSIKEIKDHQWFKMG